MLFKFTDETITRKAIILGVAPELIKTCLDHKNYVKLLTVMLENAKYIQRLGGTMPNGGEIANLEIVKEIERITKLYLRDYCKLIIRKWCDVPDNAEVLKANLQEEE